MATPKNSSTGCVVSFLFELISSAIADQNKGPQAIIKPIRLPNKDAKNDLVNNGVLILDYEIGAGLGQSDNRKKKYVQEVLPFVVVDCIFWQLELGQRDVRYSCTVVIRR